MARNSADHDELYRTGRGAYTRGLDVDPVTDLMPWHSVARLVARSLNRTDPRHFNGLRAAAGIVRPGGLQERRAAVTRSLGTQVKSCSYLHVDFSSLRMVSSTALQTRLSPGCYKIRVSSPSRFWRATRAYRQLDCRAHRRQASPRCTKHVRDIDLRRRWPHGLEQVHSAAMGSCRNGTRSRARSHEARGKGSRRGRSVHCARRKMASPRTRWRAPLTRPHSGKFAVVGCSGPVA